MPNENEIKKYKDHELDTFYKKIEIDIPDELKQTLTETQLSKLEQMCLEDYACSKIALEESIADVAIAEPMVLQFANTLASRIMTIMDICIDKEIEVKGINATPPTLDKLTNLLQCDPNTIPPDLYKSLKKNQLLTQLVSEQLKSGTSGIEKGNINAAGFVGMNPSAIRHAASKGNLREAMLIPYKTAFGFFNDFLNNPEHVKLVNAALEEYNYDWRLNEHVIATIKKEVSESPPLDPSKPNQKKDFLQYGVYALNRGERKKLPKAYRERYVETNPTIEDNRLRVSLSEREKMAYLNVYSSQPKEGDVRVQWTPGRSWFQMNYENLNDIVAKGASALKEQLIAGISGTTDQILSLAYCLGFFDTKETKNADMEIARLACLGWMIDAGDHTSHEICTSSKTFGMTYTPGPDSYKQIITNNNAEFIENLKKQQNNKGYELPDFYLTTNAVLQKAVSLGFIDAKVLTPPTDSTENKATKPKM